MFRSITFASAVSALVLGAVLANAADTWPVTRDSRAQAQGVDYWTRAPMIHGYTRETVTADFEDEMPRFWSASFVAPEADEAAPMGQPGKILRPLVAAVCPSNVGMRGDTGACAIDAAALAKGTAALYPVSALEALGVQAQL